MPDLPPMLADRDRCFWCSATMEECYAPWRPGVCCGSCEHPKKTEPAEKTDA